MGFARDQEGWIYFVRQPGVDGPVKIGFTSNLIGRLRDFERSSPVPLIVAAKVWGGEELERRFHSAFLEHHRRYEWFHPSPRLNDAIAEIAAGRFDIGDLPPPSRIIS